MSPPSGFRLLAQRYARIWAAAWRHRQDDEEITRTREEAQFLAPVQEVLQTPPPMLARAVIWVIMVFLVLAVAWAIIGRTDIVATASGKIIPDNRSKVVQSAEAGKIREIHIRDGSHVLAGDLLLSLDPTTSDADYAKVDEAYQEALAESAMTEVLATIDLLGEGNWSLISPHQIRPEIIEEYEELFHGIYDEHHARLLHLERETEVHRRRLLTERQQVEKSRVESLQLAEIYRQRRQTELANLSKIEELQPLLLERFEASRKLLEKDVIPKMEHISAQEEKIGMERQLVMSRSRIGEIDAEALQRSRDMDESMKVHEKRISELQAEVERLQQSYDLAIATFRREMLDRNRTAMARSDELRQEIVKLEQLRQAHQIRSPVSGVVQQLAVHTIGGVVQPAQSLMVIVPENPLLEVEALVENKDIGFVHQGQPVEIKIDAFPYTKYGLIEGEVLHISGDAIEDEQLGLVYRARISLENTTVRVGSRAVSLSPGMRVVSEIKTGERRIIEFFLSPLIRHWTESLDER